jgi:Flp pilus assembly protein CpaB
MSNTFSTKVSGRVSSRGWAIALGLGAIVLATILLIVYLDRYRARVSGASAPTPVLIAKQTIPAGTPGQIVANQGMYENFTLPKKEIEEGAIASPEYLLGRAAAVEILRGEQITDLDFAASTTTTVDSQITGAQRALSVSTDGIHGSLPQVKAGDNIDIYITTTLPDGKPQIELFRHNVKVLTVPGPAGGNIVLQTTTQDVPKFMFVQDHKSMWFIIRPAAGAKPTAVNQVGNEANILEGRGRGAGR